MTNSINADQRRINLPQVGRRQLIMGAAGLAMASMGGALSVRPAVAAILDNRTTLTRARLDELAARSYGIFNENKVLPDLDTVKHAAAFDVDLRRITTFTQVPETGETLKISGLLALPVGVKGPLPVVSWQHGTTFSYVQVLKPLPCR